MSAFVHFAAEAGCLEHVVLEEIRRCLGLRGGVDHDGHHWIFKSAQELSDLLGKARNTIAKALEHLVAIGALHREQLGPAVGHYTNRAWYYRIADGAPAWMAGARNASRRDRAVHCATAAQSNKNSTPVQITTKGNSPRRPTNQRPAATPQERKDTPPGQLQAVVVPGAVEGLQKALARIDAPEAVERDADGFLVRPAIEEPLAQAEVLPMAKEPDAHLYGPGPKALAIEQRVREEHPDAAEEELEKLDPIGTELWAKGRGRRIGKGFA